ncbi:MAG: HU family DNA-binding protein [Christensenellales bacterium]|jgi:DNA-binding protein HU-beta
MNKGELIRELAETTGYTQKDAAAFLDAYVEVVTKALEKGEKVQLVGFGTYELKKRAAGVRTNPQTKEKVQVPASKVPTFKFGKAYKNLFN